MNESQKPGTEGYRELPEEPVTVDQVVALNMRHWRRQAGLTQDELGERIGLTGPNVSSIEVSATEGRSRRRLDAQTVAAIAAAAGVPLSAMFLPPPDDGQGRRYVCRLPGGDLDMAALMRLDVNDTDDDNALMDVYRERFRVAATKYLDDNWAAEVAQWFREIDSAGQRADRAYRLRGALDWLAEFVTRLDGLTGDRSQLLDLAAELGGLADALEKPDPGEPS